MSDKSSNVWIYTNMAVLALKGAGGYDLGIFKIKFSIVHARGEPQLPDTFYRIKKYGS